MANREEHRTCFPVYFEMIVAYLPFLLREETFCDPQLLFKVLANRKENSSKIHVFPRCDDDCYELLEDVYDWYNCTKL